MFLANLTLPLKPLAQASGSVGFSMELQDLRYEQLSRNLDSRQASEITRTKYENVKQIVLLARMV